MKYISRLTGKPIKFKNKREYDEHIADLKSKGLLKVERSRKLRPNISRDAAWKASHSPMSQAAMRFKPPKVSSVRKRQKISLIHPSWGRPAMCRQAIYRWLDNCSPHNDVEYILSLDVESVQSYKCVVQELMGKLDLKVVVYPNPNMVHALNNAARLASGDILIYVSDDFECPPNYDIEIQKAVGRKKDWVLFVYDGMRKDIQTICILSRKYYDRFGYIYYPKYKSMFADPDYTEVAKRLGKVVDAREFLTFKHNHYSDGAAYDATYQRQNSSASWNFGEKLFNKRRAKGFGVKK